MPNFRPIAAKVAAQWLQRLNKTGNSQPERAAALAEGLIDWAKPLMEAYRYKCLYGGRGSAKSWSIADALLLTGVRQRAKILCAREFQNSIKDSVHSLLKSRIEALGLNDFYDIKETAIYGKNGTLFIFRGIRHNVNSIKSMDGITHCWVEEAHTISADSWEILVPTIREEGSEIWVSFNPTLETDVVYRDVVLNRQANSYVERVNWDRNPHFPETLEKERVKMQATDPDAYLHIWEGAFWQKSAAQVFKDKWIVEEFDPYHLNELGDRVAKPDWAGPYLGCDFGSSKPTTLLKLWIYDNRLFIERESHHLWLDIDRIPETWKEDVPGCERFIIRADSSRPDTISYLRRNGFPRICGAEKGKGSIEDGIAFIRSFEKIVIHPSCLNTIEEARMYSYKVDRYTREVLDEIIDEWNHCWDAARYGLMPLIKSATAKGTSIAGAGPRPIHSVIREL